MYMIALVHVLWQKGQSKRKQLTYLKQQNVNDGSPAQSELKRIQTPTWTTLLTNYAIKVVQFGEWAWIATSCFFGITKNGSATRGREKIAY